MKTFCILAAGAAVTAGSVIAAAPVDAGVLYQDHIGTCFGHTFGPGGRSTCVRLIQLAVGVDTDGDYGPITEAAVRRFQGYYGYQVTGITGPDQWMALCANLPAIPGRYGGCWS